MEEINPDNMRQAIRAEMRNRFKATLVAKEAQGSAKIKSIRRIPWAWAASVAILIGLGFTYWGLQGGESASSTSLFASNFEPLANTLAISTRGEEVENKLREAMVFYDAGQHENALNLFREIPVEERPEGFYLYQGISYLALGQSEQASNSILKIKPESSFYFDANWYLMLAYLQQEDEQERHIHLLRGMKNLEGHSYREEAEELLKQLKRK